MTSKIECLKKLKKCPIGHNSIDYQSKSVQFVSKIVYKSVQN